MQDPNDGLPTEPRPATIETVDSAPAPLQLVIVHDAEDEERIGQSLLVTPEARWFGRASPNGPPVAELIRRTPRGDVKFPPYPNQRNEISRRQFKFSLQGPDRVALSCPRRRDEEPFSRVNGGAPIVEASLAPGDTLAVGSAILFLCTFAFPYPAGLPPTFMPPPYGKPDQDGFVGETPEAWELRCQILDAARRDDHVLVYGPTGSGKAVVAQAIHKRSERSKRHLPLEVNAATLSTGVAAAQLFGCRRDFPNAGCPEMRGWVDAANESTLILDELGDVDPQIQPELLTFLDRGNYVRLGDPRSRTANTRVIGITNRPSQIRDDLRHRFKIHIEVVPISARRADVPWLLREAARGSNQSGFRWFGPDNRARISLEVVDQLTRHPLGGNFRDLDRLINEAASHAKRSGLTQIPRLAPGHNYP